MVKPVVHWCIKSCSVLVIRPLSHLQRNLSTQAGEDARHPLATGGVAARILTKQGNVSVPHAGIFAVWGGGLYLGGMS